MGSRQPPPQDGDGNLEIVIVRLKGNNTTLQEAIRTVSNMGYRQGGSSRPSTPTLPAKPTPALPASENGQEDSGDDLLFEPVVDMPTSDDGAPRTDQSPPSRRKRGEGENRDKNAGLTIVKTLNLQPDGKESLKDFVAKKKPKSQEEHVAVYIYYLKNVLQEPNVGYSHIYTCFKETGERMPGDLPQTCRNAASKKGWLDTADANDLKRTTRGDNLVDKDLPRAGANGDNGIK